MDSVKLIFAIMVAVGVVQLHASGQAPNTQVKIYDVATDFQMLNIGRPALIRAEKKNASSIYSVKKQGDDVSVVIVAVEQQDKLKTDVQFGEEYDMVD